MAPANMAREKVVQTVAKRSLGRELDLNLLAPLDALLTKRSVVAAAKMLNVSQPTMSGMLARLRTQFDDPLLVRIAGRSELTPYAESLKPEIRQILLQAMQLRHRQADFDPSRSRRHFRVMMSEFGLAVIFPDVLRVVQVIEPRVTFEVVPIQQPATSVYLGQVDFSITGDFLHAVTGDVAIQVRTQTLLRDEIVALVDHAHPLSGQAKIDDFLKFPHVAVQFPGSQLTVSDVGFPDFSRRHPPRLRIGSFLAAGRLVAGTDAFTLVPSRVATLANRLDTVRMVKIRPEGEANNIRLLWHRRHDLDPEQQWIRALIAETCCELRRKT